MTRDQPELRMEQLRFDSAARKLDEMRQRADQVNGSSATDKFTAAALDRFAASRRHNLPSGEPVAFGRIDLAGADRLYIGDGHIEADDIHVINWRAPAASPYYQASASQPLGVTRRRRFKCERNTIESFTDDVFADLVRRIEELDRSTSVAAAAEEDLAEQLDLPEDDEFLEELGRSTRMRSIAQTIHAAQYELITSSLDRALLVQGGAGTGKTAVALHRVSWMLFERAGSLTPRDILVVGPSKRFNEYISELLPSMGDIGVAHGHLRQMGPAASDGRPEAIATARIKGRAVMAEVLRRALFARVGAGLRPDGGDLQVTVEGRVVRLSLPDVVEALAQRSRDGSYARGQRSFREWIANEASAQLRRRVEVGQVPVPFVRTIWPDARAQDVLGELLSSQELLTSACNGLLTSEETRALWRGSDRGVSGWSDADVALLDELTWLINGPSHRYKHIVVDEAQDLSQMQLRGLLRRSPDGAMTLVGDIAQSTGPHERESWTDLIDQIGPQRVTTSSLQFGYRVPSQVNDLAARLLPVAAPGVESPRAVRAGTGSPRIETVPGRRLLELALDHAVASHERGRRTALIAEGPTAVLLLERMRTLGIRASTADEPIEGGGISVLTPADAKGLEFQDIVVLEPADIAPMNSGNVELDRRGARHLYIALTRTTGSLVVIHSKAMPLLGLRKAWLFNF